MTPESTRRVADAMVSTLGPVTSADWNSRAGGLEWSCRTTIEHMGHAMDRYALYLAGAVQERLPFGLVSHPECSPADLLRVAELRAAALCEVARAASPETRGFHAFGRADRGGYIAMGCVEMMVHTEDIAKGLGTSFTPPTDLVREVLARLFPWAPSDTDAWQTLQWATGRVDLPGHARVAPDWAWHASPLSEWDGTIKTQASYR
jgi:uncharacterized protein (TIGR03083 family)